MDEKGEEVRTCMLFAFPFCLLLLTHARTPSSPPPSSKSINLHFSLGGGGGRGRGSSIRRGHHDDGRARRDGGRLLWRGDHGDRCLGSGGNSSRGGLGGRRRSDGDDGRRGGRLCGCGHGHHNRRRLLLLTAAAKDLPGGRDADDPPRQHGEHDVLLLPRGRVAGRLPGVGDLNLAVGVCFRQGVVEERC